MAGEMWTLAETRIGRAIQSGSIPDLKAALADGENVLFKDRKGNTYLHYVCTMYRPYIFNILAAANIDINARNRGLADSMEPYQDHTSSHKYVHICDLPPRNGVHGNTALHVTALHRECGHVSDLMTNGVDPFIKNQNGKLAAELNPTGKYWHTIYQKYQPGIFGAVEEHDVERFQHLLHCWSRIDAMRDGLTLRQFAAARKHHDLVLLLDQHRFTADAIFGVLEVNHAKVEHSAQSEKCNINYLNKASELCHILLHAIRLKDHKMVQLVCRAGANVNLPITLQNYLKAPMFFAAISPRLPVDIVWTVLKTKPNLLLKDHRGRNAVVFALDKSNREVPLEIIEFMMQNGVYLADRDVTGITARDVARLARRHDVLKLLDRMYIKLLREEEMFKLERLSQDSYDSMLIEFNDRDTYIYACGNETDDVVEFVQQLPDFQARIRRLQRAVQKDSVDAIRQLIEDHPKPFLLANCKDKGGRSLLHLAVLHWRTDVMRYLLTLPYTDFNAQDNLLRTPYHYACAMKEEEREHFKKQLEETGCDTSVVDCRWLTGMDYEADPAYGADLDKERNVIHGLYKQLKCLDKYESLRRIIRNKRRTLKDLKMAIRDFPYPVASFARVLSPIVDGFRDLIFVAVDSGQVEMAEYLAHLGADLTRKEKYELQEDATGTLKLDVTFASTVSEATTAFSLTEGKSAENISSRSYDSMDQEDEQPQQLQLGRSGARFQHVQDHDDKDLTSQSQSQESDQAPPETHETEERRQPKADRRPETKPKPEPERNPETGSRREQRRAQEAGRAEPSLHSEQGIHDHGQNRGERGDISGDLIGLVSASTDDNDDASEAQEEKKVRTYYLSVVERARQLGMDQLAKVFVRKLKYYRAKNKESEKAARKKKGEDGKKKKDDGGEGVEEEEEEEEWKEEEVESMPSDEMYDSDFYDSNTEEEDV